MKEEPFFIAYANLPLFDAPGKLIDLVQAFFPPEENEEIVFVLQAIKKFHLAKCDHGATVCLNRHPEEYEQIAYAAVYGYMNCPCEDCLGFPLEQCSWLDPERRQLHCFECQQVQFRHRLKSAIRDRFDVSWLHHFAQDSKRIVGIHIEPSLEALSKKYGKYGGGIDAPIFGLEEKISFDMSFLREAWGAPDDPYFDRFNFFIRGIVHFDLLNFLKHSNRDLIKLCPVCDRYSIGARAGGTYCSDKCRYDFHNGTEKAKQRKRTCWQAHKHQYT